jgi:CDP-glycerol glycerophosphotransferase (TagB/SpsB family)
VGIYERLATAAGMKGYSILRDINLYELLYASDLVILSYSTVAVEAMRMQKPVISLDLMSLHESVSFIKSRVAIVVNNADDLLTSIQKCLALGPDVQEIVNKAKSFAEQQLGALDGRASERIVSVIMKVSQGNHKTPLLGDGNAGE